MISRLIENELKSSSKSILLLGPRQVGKSTLIRSFHPDLIINLADEKEYLDFSSNPALLRSMLKSNKPATVFIDEIQRIPSLLNTIQAIIDEDIYSQEFGIKFYLSGSSARKLKRGQANLLPGRVFLYQLAPLSAKELEYKLDVERAMKFGTLPEAYLSENNKEKEKLLVSYAAIYLKEEVQSEALTRNLTGFSRFLMLAAEYSSKVLDYSKMAKLAKIERKQCGRFYEILEDTLLGIRIECFEKTNLDINRRPKFFFFDTGVLNGLLENFNLSSDRKGFIFEHLFLNQVMNSAKANDLKLNIWYFRTRSSLEVDFILEINGVFVAVEIKSGPVEDKSLKNLLRFKEVFPQVQSLYVVSAVESNLRESRGVTICGLNEFLRDIQI